MAGFKKTTKNYARTFKPTMTQEKYYIEKVMGNATAEERKRIYEELLNEVEDLETLEEIAAGIKARRQELREMK